MEADGTFEVLPKKEVIELRKELAKLQKNLGGIKEMKRLPDAIFIVEMCIRDRLTVEKIEKLENGVDIGEKNLTMPAKAEIVGGSWEGAGEPEPGRVRRENLPEVYTELHLTIHEGKFHQVKRMMAAVGTPVIYLKRIAM